ncbi:MAG: hypothetical protein Q7W45_08655 [Bacteroidota bacterium]|nr:hypothetical protein [Bacteroidota bacterium]MDP3144252.1 hypothetical protein [Bacteroidota bacterium]
MTSKRLLLPLLALIIIASSCSSKFSVSKRRYMKGYHVDFAKNKTLKNNQSPEKELKEVKASALVKENNNKEENVFASAVKKPNENVDAASNSIIKTKIKSLNQKTNLDLLLANRSSSKKNIFLPQIQNKNINQSNSFTNKNVSNKPFDFWGGGGSIGSAFVYAFVGLIASLLFAFLIFGFFALVLSGGGAGVVFPIWLSGALIVIGLLILLAIIVVVVINGD